MMIEIDDDFVDTIIQGALVKDYVHLTNSLKQKNYWHEEDEEAFKETVQGIEILAKWYFCKGDFEKAVKKAKKAK